MYCLLFEDVCMFFHDVYDVCKYIYLHIYITCIYIYMYIYIYTYLCVYITHFKIATAPVSVFRLLKIPMPHQPSFYRLGPSWFAKLLYKSNQWGWLGGCNVTSLRGLYGIIYIYTNSELRGATSGCTAINQLFEEILVDQPAEICPEARCSPSDPNRWRDHRWS